MLAIIATVAAGLLLGSYLVVGVFLITPKIGVRWRRPRVPIWFA